MFAVVCQTVTKDSNIIQSNILLKESADAVCVLCTDIHIHSITYIYMYAYKYMNISMSIKIAPFEFHYQLLMALLLIFSVQI